MSLPTIKDLEINFKGAYIPSQASIDFWENVPYMSITPSTSASAVPLNTKIFHNKDSKELVLIMTGFNEPMTKYFEVVQAFYTAGFSVCLYDHRAQCLSERETNLSKEEPQIAWVECFSSLVEDGVDMAIKAKSITEAQYVHLFAHSMGGLIGTYASAKRQDVFNGQVIMSCPMIETYWGEEPPGLPRQVAHTLGWFGWFFGQGQKLPPIPGARLSWWDPHAPIVGVNITHDAGRLSWFHALRSLNPKMAMLGVSMGWIKEMTNAQARAPRIMPAIKNPVLLLTAELDSLVRPDGHETFVKQVPNSSRVLVKGSFHEPLFEVDSIRKPALSACLKWLKRDTNFEFDLRYPLVLMNRFEDKEDKGGWSKTKVLLSTMAVLVAARVVIGVARRRE